MSYIKWTEINVLHIYSVYKNINDFRCFDGQFTEDFVKRGKY